MSQLDAEFFEFARHLMDVVQEIAGTHAAAGLEQCHRLAERYREGDPAALEALQQTVSEMSESDLRVALRGLAILLDLANVAEDRQRVRILRERERELAPKPRAESIRDAIGRLQDDGFSPEQMQRLVEGLDVELVLTAHPTEAKRRSIRFKLRRIRELLTQRDDDRLLPRETAELTRQLRAELTKLWQTDFIRPWRPTVQQEVHRGLSIKAVLWDLLPEMLEDLRQALAESYPDDAFRVRPFLRFASWIGGDRDGHPHVTAEVTEQTLRWLRQAAIEYHREVGCQLYGSLSLSSRQAAGIGRAGPGIGRSRGDLAGTGPVGRFDSSERDLPALAAGGGLAFVADRSYRAGQRPAAGRLRDAGRIRTGHPAAGGQPSRGS